MKKFISIFIVLWIVTVHAAVTVNVNGTNHTIPQTNEKGWGNNVTAWIQAISQYTLQKNGGSFTLTADTDFGANYGLKSIYLKSRATNPAGTGVLRLGNTEEISWRNAANSANLGLTVNSSNQLTYNGVVLASTTAPTFQDSQFTLFDNSDTTKLLQFQLSGITTGTTRTLTVPDANTTVVGTDTTQTLTNKTLTSPVISTISNTGTLTLPTSTDTLVGRATTDTLTNKTLTAPVIATISNSGTLTLPTSTDTLVGRATTDTLTNKTLTAPVIATISNTGTLTLPTSTDTLVGRATTDTLTNKTINGSNNTISNVSLTTGVTGTLPATNGGTGTATYTTGDILYASATNTLSKLSIGSSNQVLTTVAGVPAWSTVSGGINYLASNNNAEGNATTGWATYADAAGSTPVDGTGGSPSSTWSVSSSSPLRGTYSFLWTKSAANRQGEGVSFDFTIANADQAKPIQIDFDWALVSGTWAGSVTPGTNSDMTVWVYDVTNAALIAVSGSLLEPAVTSTYYKYRGVFQTASNSTSYRLIIHTATTSASAYTLKFDNFSVGPQVIANGAAESDWTSFTPTGSWSTNTTYTGFRKRVGDSEEFVIQVATSGAPTSATLSINLPVTIDTSKLVSTQTDYAIPGQGNLLDSGTKGYTISSVLYGSTTTVVPTYDDGTSGQQVITQASPFTFAANDRVWLSFKVPVVGRSSNVQMSNDTDTRVVSARTYRATSTQSINNATATKIQLNAKSFDTHGATDIVTNHRITIPVAGKYQIKGSISYAANATGVRYAMIYKNGSQAAGATIAAVGASDASIPQVATDLDLTVGDYIELYGSQSSGGALNVNNDETTTYLSVTRVSGPSQIAASEKISYHGYRTTSSSALSAATDTIIAFSTTGKDSHGGINGSFNRYTVQSAGDYLVSANISFSFGASTTVAQVKVFKNGSIYSMPAAIKGASGDLLSANPAIILPNLVPGDYIEIYGRVDAGTATVIYGDSFKNTSLSINRL